ncbi:MAG: Uncharacterized protein FD152_1426 [Xanthobacteraceae bacterium]|nr:MAG: Uncharacterized protein FD152_1426 [Xanthobacteraceae bacterium]
MIADTASHSLPTQARIAGIAVPGLREMVALMVGGFAGLGLWEIWANVPTAIVAGGPLEPPALIKALFAARLGFEPSDIVARALHYVTGVVGYPLGYFLLTRNGISLGRRWNGWIWGTFTTFIALGIFAPLAGLPFMLLAWGGQLTVMSTIGHALYGAMAAWVTEMMLDNDRV